jgi:protein-S-isoprenylcysteine O-methyltransferase Ste14
MGRARMTITVAKAIFTLGLIAWALIRAPHQRRSHRIPVRLSARGSLDWLLLMVAAAGLAIVPGIFVFSPLLHRADYAFQPILAWLGTAILLGALSLFYLAHRDLGRNFSTSLEIRRDHLLVTGGIYRRLRHPMYLACWLWAAAQVLLLPNWIAGLAGLVGFGILFLFRVRREERLMLEEFGQQYRRYMRRTERILPWIY